MLTAKELRVGNLIHHWNWRKLARKIDPDVGVVTGISKNRFRIDDAWEGLPKQGPARAAEGIPITEEWLYRCGFEDFVHRLLNDDSLECWKQIAILHPSEGACGGHNLEVPCRYVHQLQNLFFALTGEELKINNEQS